MQRAARTFAVLLALGRRMIDVITALSGVVAAVAALAALYFARRPVSEAAAARREERRASEVKRLERAADVVAGIGDTVAEGWYRFPAAHGRLRVFLAARGLDLPAVSALAALPPDHPHQGGATDVREVVVDALDELRMVIEEVGTLMARCLLKDRRQDGGHA